MKPLIITIAAMLAVNLSAAPLKIVTVSAPPINCIFDTTCVITVTDTTAAIPIAGIAGKAILQSRTFKSKPSAPAAGRYMYQYRLDLTNAYGVLSAPCVTSLAIEFGAVVSTLDYNKDGIAGDQVFVLTKGGLGTVGPSSVDKAGNTITFVFATPVCAGSAPGNGDSSYFFGLTATSPPKAVTAKVKEATGPISNVPARAPSLFVIKPGGGGGRGPSPGPGL